MLIGLVLQLLTFHSLSLKTTHGGMWCISDTKSRSALSVTRVLIPGTPDVVQPCCINKVSVNCDIQNDILVYPLAQPLVHLIKLI